ncbi:MAG: CHAP domain-containing protein [Spirochaetales bacterium]|nr:CHAP domain-containing protein [Spirochaetales bacterium]
MRESRSLLLAGLLPGILVFHLLVSCATLDLAPGGRPAARARLSSVAEVARVQEKLAEGGRYVLGRRELVIRGRRFNMDCTGAVLAIYYYAGIDLSRDFDRYSGGGVMRLYQSLEARDLVYDSRAPATGDIIFWDNTYDRNGDGQWNDGLTHVGMVMAAGEDGTIEYVHLNYRKGIVIEYMNLNSPDVHQNLERGSVQIVNSPMRMKQKDQGHPERWLSSQLYRNLGMGYLF